MSVVLIVVATFLAAAVEWVEALTIVLAVGMFKGWRNAITGTLLGVVAQLAFGAYRVEGGQAQFQVLCDLVGEVGEHGGLRLGQFPGGGVDRGHRAEVVPVGGDDRGGGVEPQP